VDARNEAHLLGMPILRRGCVRFLAKMVNLSSIKCRKGPAFVNRSPSPIFCKPTTKPKTNEMLLPFGRAAVPLSTDPTPLVPLAIVTTDIEKYQASPWHSSPLCIHFATSFPSNAIQRWRLPEGSHRRWRFLGRPRSCFGGERCFLFH